MLTTCPSRVDRATDLWDELGELEDEIAATGWAWDAELSHRVDRLLVRIEGLGA